MLEELRKFLIAANKAGYASSDLTKEREGEDKSTTIQFKQGDWRMHDNYFGGEPYGGRQVIFYKEQPYWIMVYYGYVKKGIDANSIVYPFLQKAFKALPENMPLRGPKELKGVNLRYVNSWSGTLENYKGEEIIYHNDQEVYRAWYMGGLVDQSK